MEIAKTKNSQNHLENEQRWKTHKFKLQNLLQSNSNQDNCRSKRVTQVSGIESESTHQPSHLCSITFHQGCQGNSMRGRIIFSTNCAGTIEYLHTKE